MKNFLILPLFAFLAVSCASNHTPAKRIAKQPEAYESLSSRHKELVERGEIEDGMRPEAVLLAWGKPAAHSIGQEKGREIEKWTYTSSAPVYHQSYHGGFGFGRSSRFGKFGRFGRFGGRGGHGFGSFGGFGTQVSFVPYRSAWVKFSDGRVDSWQRSARR